MFIRKLNLICNIISILKLLNIDIILYNIEYKSVLDRIYNKIIIINK